MYVDDLIITGARMKDIDGFKPEMLAQFCMNDLGQLSYLGITVKHGSDFISIG
jgi:hypothetical protein